MANSDAKDVFPVFLEDVDLSANERTRGVKFIISSVNWTMFRSGVEDYKVSLDKLVQGLSEKGKCQAHLVIHHQYLHGRGSVFCSSFHTLPCSDYYCHQ